MLRENSFGVSFSDAEEGDRFFVIDRDNLLGVRGVHPAFVKRVAEKSVFCQYELINRPDFRVKKSAFDGDYCLDGGEKFLAARSELRKNRLEKDILSTINEIRFLSPSLGEEKKMFLLSQLQSVLQSLKDSDEDSSATKESDEPIWIEEPTIDPFLGK